ncbi:hypothetical protein AQPE_1520 [Aquipluma nitroreducens]|uniref:Uncharacterized protein n=1 Tax=Aquipluma nitroreducens TaxID=2010828 RepID=A0A5K7S778_9BACT|nr:hypothetical protein AQPE_1520 [Aquipluma nitroreducens]
MDFGIGSAITISGIGLPSVETAIVSTRTIDECFVIDLIKSLMSFSFEVDSKPELSATVNVCAKLRNDVKIKAIAKAKLRMVNGFWVCITANRVQSKSNYLVKFSRI